MDRETFKRAIASYNPDIHQYSDDEQLGVWPTNKEPPHLDREENKYTTNNNRPSDRKYSKMAQKGPQGAPFHSALNPLEYYQDHDDVETYGNNQLQKLAELNKKLREEDEELEYQDNQYNQNTSFSQEEPAEDNLSSNSLNGIRNAKGRTSNREKPGSIPGSIQNASSREFKSMYGTDYSKKDKDGNMTLELSPEATADKIMNDISQEMLREDERRRMMGVNEYTKDEKPTTRSHHNYHTTFEDNRDDHQFNTSREIMMSDDMKRNLKNVMEENSVGELEDSYDDIDSPNEQHDRRPSFGRPNPNESEKFAAHSTPKMGSRTVRQSPGSDDHDEDERTQNRNENLNPYHDQSSRTDHLDSELGLNLSKLDLKNKNFSDLVISGKLTNEVLMERIAHNQNLFDEHSESLKNQVINYSTSSQLLKTNSQDHKYDNPNDSNMNTNKIEPTVNYSRLLASQLNFGSRESSRRNDKVNSS